MKLFEITIIILVDTQEAPKSLSLDSRGSMESLASTEHSESRILERPCSTGAFATYVRHSRGEPDGKTMNVLNSTFSGENGMHNNLKKNIYSHMIKKAILTSS